MGRNKPFQMLYNLGSQAEEFCVSFVPSILHRAPLQGKPGVDENVTGGRST